VAAPHQDSSADVGYPALAIGPGDVGDLLLGARLLSSGGGSRGHVTARWLCQTLAASGPVRLVPPAALPADALCLAVGLVGSPTIQSEKLPAGDEFIRAVRAAERRLDSQVAAVAGLDAAGVNALTPVIAASQLSLPLADADGMGRMFPLIEQTVFTLAGLPVGPMMLASPNGDLIVVEPSDNRRTEMLARPAIIALGGWCAAALYPMTAANLARHGIQGSLGRALDLGRVLSAAARRGEPKGVALAESLGGRLLVSGTIVEVHRPTRLGFPRGAAIVADLDDPEHMVRLETQNECLLALADGVPLAAVPDLICLIECGTCEPVDVEQLHYGQVIDVVTFPAAPAWHTPSGLVLAGPMAFGYRLPAHAIPARKDPKQ
jgi:uncharacterized protein